MAVNTFLNDSIENQNNLSETSILSEKSPRRRTRRRGQKNNRQPLSLQQSGNVSDSGSSDGSTKSYSTNSTTSSSSIQSQSPRRVKKTTDKHNNNKSTKNEVVVSLEEQQMYLAMDCEMVGVGLYGRKSALARVTIVDWDYNVVLDQFIKPNEPVVDYRTYVSGITEADLFQNENAVDIETCREMVSNIIGNKILVGHALKNDLNALRIQHPWQLTRDTAKYEPFMKIRFEEDGILWPRKLKDLCAEHLQIEIQNSGLAHSSYEDSVSALKLYKEVRTKWEKVMTYKIQKTASLLAYPTTSVEANEKEYECNSTSSSFSE